MRRSSKILLGVAVLLLGGAGLLLLSQSRPRPDAETLIRQALQEAEQAARRRDVAGVMEIVSQDYKDAANLNKARLRLLLTRYVRQSVGTRYDVRVSPRLIQRDEGDPDRAVVLATITVFDPANRENLWGGEELSLVMRREQRRRWLLLPEDRWRVISVVNVPSLPGLGGEGGGGIFGF